MKWTVKLVAEVGQGEALEREIATIEREDQVSPASIGLTIAEGKSIMEGLQRELVTGQMEQHEAAIQSCQQCGRAFRTKGYYQGRNVISRSWRARCWTAGVKKRY
jgi:hypothetical protein